MDELVAVAEDAVVWPLPSLLAAGHADAPFDLICASDARHLASADVSKAVPLWKRRSIRLIVFGTSAGAPGSLHVISGTCPLGAPGSRDSVGQLKTSTEKRGLASASPAVVKTIEAASSATARMAAAPPYQRQVCCERCRVSSRPSGNMPSSRPWSARITCITALIRARCVKACGKLPRWRPVRGSISSA